MAAKNKYRFPSLTPHIADEIKPLMTVPNLLAAFKTLTSWKTYNF
jgi:hypothetical protein